MDALLTMCLQGSAMIAAVLVLRRLLRHRLPQVAFVALWAVVLVRLLVPVSIPLPVNAWSLAGQGLAAVGIAPATDAADGEAATAGTGATADADASAAEASANAAPSGTAAPSSAGAASATASDPEDDAPSAPSTPTFRQIASVAWCVGAAACALAFVGLYAHHTRRFADAVELDNRATRQWLAAHPLRRRLRIKESARVASPLTYGVLRPTILVPPGFDWKDPSKSALVLEHEFVHVARLDVLFKALLAAAACLYWFDPLVWVLYACANRDVELACDEAVARRLNGHGRALYAHALIDMVERRTRPMPAFSGFGRSAVEQRIHALDRVRPATWTAGLATTLLAVGVAALFATSAPPVARAQADGNAASLTTGTARTALVSEEPAGQGVRLVSVTRDDDGAAGATTRLRAPRYTLTLHDDMFPDGYTWSFAETGASPAPAGASDVLTVADGATGEVLLVVYCRPAAVAEEQAMPGYVQLVQGTSASDPTRTVVLAVPETRFGTEGSPFAGVVARLQPTLTANGLLSDVYGLDGGNATREAYAAYAEQDASGDARIVTPYFSILVPADYADELFVSYSEYDSSGALSPQVNVIFADSSVLHSILSIRTAAEVPAPYRDTYNDVHIVASDVTTDAGLHVYAHVIANYGQNDDGSWELLSDEAQTFAELGASWVEPAGDDAPAPAAQRSDDYAGGVVQSGSVGTSASAQAKIGDGRGAAQEAPLANDLVSVVAIEGGTRLVTPCYQVDVPAALVAGELRWSYSEGWRSPAPAGMQGVLTVVDGATGDVAFVAYRCPAGSYGAALDPMPGYVQYDVGTSSEDGSLVVLALPEGRAGDAATVLQGFDAGYPGFGMRGSLGSAYGLETAAAGETVLVQAAQDAYIAYAVEEEGGTRIVTPRYSVLVPASSGDVVAASYQAGPLGCYGVVDSLDLWLADGDQISVECGDGDTVRSWGPPNEDYYLYVADGAETYDGLNVVVSTSITRAPSPAEQRAVNEVHAGWVTVDQDGTGGR